LAVPSLAAADRAALLLRAVESGLTKPKSAERDIQLERLVDKIDVLAPAALEQVIEAHLAMRTEYWAVDNYGGVIKHATWIMDAARTFTAGQRKVFGSDVVTAHVDLAQAWAGQGRTAEALALLRRAKTEWADLPDTNGTTDPEIARLELVGRPAAPLTAPRWLNMPAGTTELNMKGSVTLLEFGAWWCKPCANSYPALNRLQQRYSAQGFRVVIATRLFGYFENGEGMPGHTLREATEVERNRAYFARHGLDVPIGIGGHTTVVDGVPRFGRDENYEHYLVGAIPQVQLIDRQGKIRHIMVGFDGSNEAGLAKIIEGLLKEK
jgi:thiol-disulfide isomerase/thioredoxin